MLEIITGTEVLKETGKICTEALLFTIDIVIKNLVRTPVSLSTQNGASGSWRDTLCSEEE